MVTTLPCENAATIRHRAKNDSATCVPGNGQFQRAPEAEVEIPGLRPRHFPASVPALQASAENPSPRPDDGRLWVIALAASLFLSGLILLAAAATVTILDVVFVIDKALANRTALKAEPPTSVIISPEMIQEIVEKSADATPKPSIPPRAAPDFARTSEDQRGKRPDGPAFIGERDTEATSDRAPDPTAKRLPSQRGETPRDPDDLETTQSNYRDGKLEAAGEKPASSPAEMTPAVPASSASVEPSAPENPAADPAVAKPAPPAKPAKNIGDTAKAEVAAPTELLQGQNPVDVNVPKPAPEQSLPPKPAAPAAEKSNPDSKQPTLPKPKTTAAPGDPGFRGNQRKKAIQGSISRTGRSALDVADTPLGRYQAIISSAVELEWQRNCVRHRDFITPGFLTLRFYILPNGKVKNVQFVKDRMSDAVMQVTEIQKGFTLNAIRDAPIPPMPKEIRADYEDEALELIFTFYF